MPAFSFLLSVLAAGQPTFAAPQCRESNGVLEMEGKQVHLNFVAHRSLREIEILNAIIEAPEQVTPDTLRLLNQLFEKIDGVMHFDEQLSDARRLKDLIGRGKVDWIGVEFSPSELQLRNSSGMGARDLFLRLERALSAAGASPALIDKALLTYAGSPARYVYFRNRSIQSRVPLVALDSDDLKARAVQLDDQTSLHSTIISIYGKKVPARAPDTSRILKKLGELSQKWTELSDDEISSFALTVPDPDLSSFTRTALKTQREFFRNQKARDAFAAGVVLNQGGNGWISEGSMHGGLTDRILERCQSQGADAAAQTSAPPAGIGR